MNTLVTGGAGFIGSHLVDALLDQGHQVRVLDDLSNGFERNVPSGAELIVGDVADSEAVERAVAGSDMVFHLAALGSVKRSVEYPLRTDIVNAHGTLTILDAARRHGVARVVMSSSSSVYGGVQDRPAAEDDTLRPKSPYAVSKLAAEQYCRVFSEVYGLTTVVLRYFNVYGPRQRSDSPYAAAIPLFIEALRGERRPTVYGDGFQTRDFTFVADAVAANLAASQAPETEVSGQAFNVAGGASHSLLDLLEILGELLNVKVEPIHLDPRPGDVRHSAASLARADGILEWKPSVRLAEGLRRTVDGV